MTLLHILVQPLNLSPRLDTTKPKCKWFDVGFSEVGQPAEWKVNEAEMNTNPQKSVSLDITPNSPELVTRVRACHIAMSVDAHTHTNTSVRWPLLHQTDVTWKPDHIWSSPCARRCSTSVDLYSRLLPGLRDQTSKKILKRTCSVDFFFKFFISRRQAFRMNGRWNVSSSGVTSSECCCTYTHQQSLAR